jgi:hypothetical protein
MTTPLPSRLPTSSAGAPRQADVARGSYVAVALGPSSLPSEAMNEVTAYCEQKYNGAVLSTSNSYTDGNDTTVSNSAYWRRKNEPTATEEEGCFLCSILELCLCLGDCDCD